MTAFVGLDMGMTAVDFGLGKHINDITSSNDLYQAIKWDFVQSFPLGLAAMFIRISICIFLNRIFVQRQTKWTCKWILHFTNAVNIIGNVISATTELTQCSPVQNL